MFSPFLFSFAKNEICVTQIQIICVTHIISVGFICTFCLFHIYNQKWSHDNIKLSWFKWKFCSIERARTIWFIHLTVHWYFCLNRYRIRITVAIRLKQCFFGSSPLNVDKILQNKFTVIFVYLLTRISIFCNIVHSIGCFCKDRLRVVYIKCINLGDFVSIV